jgi:hypothetical protein
VARCRGVFLAVLRPLPRLLQPSSPAW